MSNNRALRDHLLYLLRGGGAHIGFDEAIGDLPAKLRGAKPAGLPHTPWRLLEHMRIALWDIVEFCKNPDHVSPEFPDGYWPPEDEPPDAQAWDCSVASFREDLEAMQQLVAESDDLLAPIPHAGQTLLREVLVVADHNAYHLGQLVMIRRSVGAWEPDELC